MPLNAAAIAQFREIYQQEFGPAITDEEAKVMANRVFHFFKTIITEINKEQKSGNFSQRGGVNKTIYDHENKSNQI